MAGETIRIIPALTFRMNLPYPETFELDKTPGAFENWGYIKSNDRGLDAGIIDDKLSFIFI